MGKGTNKREEANQEIGDFSMFTYLFRERMGGGAEADGKRIPRKRRVSVQKPKWGSISGMMRSRQLGAKTCCFPGVGGVGGWGGS